MQAAGVDVGKANLDLAVDGNRAWSAMRKLLGIINARRRDELRAGGFALA